MQPARAVSPTTILRRELQARNLSLSPDLQPLIDRDLPITPEIAQQLGALLGTSQEFWLNLEGNYRAR